MSLRFYLSVLIYLVVQGVLFGVGTVAIMASPLKDYADLLLPLLIGLTFIIAVPVAWNIAPRLMADPDKNQYNL